MGTMPEMMNKPNMGTMPEMMNKPNMGAMPEMTAKPNTAAVPYTSKPNLGIMTEMTNKPNVAVMPEMMNKPNAGTMPYMQPKSNVQGLMEEEKGGCGYKNGELPSCAPLSVGFVPFQQKNPPKYEKSEALTRGTLFPGLDLPFMDTVNKTNPYAGTPLGDLMALGFAIKELNLYLDTHPRDREALEMMQSLNKMMKDGQEKFIQMFGPQTIMDILSGDTYDWIDNPWPWEFKEQGGGK
jgi:spore coat protein JB